MSTPRGLPLIVWTGLWAASVLGGGCGSSGARPGHAAPSLAIVSGGDQRGLVGHELREPVVVRISDPDGQPVAGQAVHFEATGGGGTVIAERTTSDDAGLASGRWTLGPTEGLQTLEVSAVAPQNGAASASARVSATAYGTSVVLVPVSGLDQTATVGTALPQPIVFQLQDRDGVGVEGQDVHVGVDGGGAVSADLVTTGIGGLGSLTWQLGTRAGSLQQLSFELTDPSTGAPVPPLEVTAAALAGAPTAIALHPPHLIEDIPYWDSWPGPARFVADVADAYGNPVPGEAVEFAVSDGGTVSPASAVTDAGGEAVANWTFALMTGPQTMQATVDGLSAEFRRDVTEDDFLDGSYLGPETCAGVIAFSVQNHRLHGLYFDDVLVGGCFDVRSSTSPFFTEYKGCIVADTSGGATATGYVYETHIDRTMCYQEWTATRQRR